MIYYGYLFKSWKYKADIPLDSIVSHSFLLFSLHPHMGYTLRAAVLGALTHPLPTPALRRRAPSFLRVSALLGPAQFSLSIKHLPETAPRGTEPHLSPPSSPGWGRWVLAAQGLPTPVLPLQPRNFPKALQTRFFLEASLCRASTWREAGENGGSHSKLSSV